MANPAPKIRISIRFKLLLVASSLLIVPWIIAKFIPDIEFFLLGQQGENLLTRTQMVAAVMQTHPDLFNTQTVAPLPTTQIQHVFVRPLQSAIQLDGYIDDWQPYQERMQSFNANNAVKGSETNTLSFGHQLGTYKNYLYAVFKIEDDRIIYRQPNSLLFDKNDHLKIVLEDKSGNIIHYIVTTIAPGWVNAHQVSEHLDKPEPIRPESRIKGEWQETATGYNIEIRIPLRLLGGRLSFAIADVDHEENREIDTLIATAGLTEDSGLGTLMFPSQVAENILTGLERQQTQLEQRLTQLEQQLTQSKHPLPQSERPLTRTWVIDLHNRVIARTGSLVKQSKPVDDIIDGTHREGDNSFFVGLITILYDLVLDQPTTEFHDERLNASRLNSKEFQLALQGNIGISWRDVPDKDIKILTATYPVYAKQRVIGAVAIEQTSNSILFVKNRALKIMFNLSALAFIIACVVLLAFATRLSLRVRRLRDATDQAITADGRVVGEIKATRDRDEIGDLSRGVADMLDRLAEYNRYLEGMASKLSHELRTPITVVRSSLENLTDTDENKVYIDRAKQGIERLNNILTRMSEATRLEQTLQSEEVTPFNLAKVVEGCIEGYRLAHPDTLFELNISSDERDPEFNIIGAPELIAQMLDKLISNALDFHAKDTPIVIQLNKLADKLELNIANTGPTLPSEMQSSLFESMVSVRDKKAEQPHLGLGLYIVRLIIEYHNGTVIAKNIKDETGVTFSIQLPLENI